MTDKEVLTELLGEAQSYLNKNLTYNDNNDIKAWNNSLKRQCERIYGKNSRVSSMFNNRTYVPGFYSAFDSEEEITKEEIYALNDGLKQTICDLKRLIKECDYTSKEEDVKNVKSEKAKGTQTININVDASSKVNNKNALSSSNTNSITIKSYNAVKNEIIDNTYLDDDSKKELLAKLDEIKKLEASSDGKAKKWETGKKILGYILNKGVDIAIAYIPLILQAISK